MSDIRVKLPLVALSGLTEIGRLPKLSVRLARVQSGGFILQIG